MGATRLTLEQKRQETVQYSYDCQGFQSTGNPAIDADLQTCVDVLKKMQSFSRVARDHLVALGSQDHFICGGF
jgi:hypothetical protein